MLKRGVTILIALGLLSSCGITNNTLEKYPDTINISNNENEKEIIIHGKVDFPSGLNAFTVKAESGTITNLAVVTLINTQTNQVEGVALTDSTGVFGLVAGASRKFTPSEDIPYILEANKRVNNEGEVDPLNGKLVSLRTMVVFRKGLGSFLTINGISGLATAVKINKYTTALSIMYAKGQITNINDIIGKINPTNPVAVAIPNTTITAEDVENLANQVESQITQNIDPLDTNEDTLVVIPTITNISSSTNTSTQSIFTVTGTNFAAGMTASINGVSAASVTLTNSITATVVFNRPVSGASDITGLLIVTLNGQSGQSVNPVTVPKQDCEGGGDICGGIGG